MTTSRLQAPGGCGGAAREEARRTDAEKRVVLPAELHQLRDGGLELLVLPHGAYREVVRRVGFSGRG